MTTAIEPVQEVALQESTGYQLVAIDRPQLETAHAKMIDWAKEMQSRVAVEKAGEEENLRIAEERKWATTHFKKRIAGLVRQGIFYEKIEAALRAGYVIVPNFEMTVFGIRTTADSPRSVVQENSWARNATSFEQQSQRLPAGEGEWKNPLPTVHTEQQTTTNEKGVKSTTHLQWAEEFRDFDFPIALAKPVLMNRTAEAMALKVFDEVGVAVDTMSKWRGNRRGDPFILGRIRNPRQRADITFFIGWYFDPTNL